MRVVAGKLRHRIIDMTNLETTRETQDKVRQAIFNMIGPYFDGGVCLDLFTGSGAMAIEAYSRGINEIHLNDLNKDALDVAKRNCLNLKINDAYFTNQDYKDFSLTNKTMYTLIILDPPYKMDDIEEITLSILPFLEVNGLIVYEMKKESNFNINIPSLEIIKNKEYGIKRVVIYKRCF